MSENHTVNKCFRKSESFISGIVRLCPLTHVIHSMFNRGKEMVEDVITVIHDCLKKTHVIFITDYIERGLVWWKIALLTIGPRVFAVACSKSWNSLPQDLRVPSITQGKFRNMLKTVLFEEMLSGRLWGYFPHSSDHLFRIIHVIFRTQFLATAVFWDSVLRAHKTSVIIIILIIIILVLGSFPMYIISSGEDEIKAS